MLKSMQGFDEFARDLIHEWNAPGAGVAVVKDGEVVHNQGYGFRILEEKLPVTPKTLFAIGSTTKAFTAAAMGILVDDGVLEWDRPIKEYIPEFKMADPAATTGLTVRDMLCHRSGLARHDLSFYHRKLTRKELVQTLAYLESSHPLRSRWQYQNILYATAGYLVEVLTGKTWEEFVQERIFQTMGMTGTNLSVTDTQNSNNYCCPYAEKDGMLGRVPFANLDAVGPAGSINSTLEDMSKWLIMNLSKGKFGEKQIISETSMAEIHRPQMVMLDDNPFSELGTDSHPDYGFGWMIYHYRGVEILEHSGGVDGFTTEVVMVPKENLGVVTFSNVISDIPMILYRNVLDRLLGKEPIDWNDVCKKDRDKAKEAQKEASEKSSDDRKMDTKPTHPLQDYTGKFLHPGYGEIEFKLVDSQLTVFWRTWTFPLNHYHYDVFNGVVSVLEIPVKFVFEMNEKGDIARVVSPLEASVKPIVFTRVKAEEERPV